MSTLKTIKPGPVPVIKPVYEACGFCHDEGVVMSDGLTIRLFEVPVFVAFPFERPCTACRTGRERLADWQADNICKCAYGWLRRAVVEQSAGGRMVEQMVVETCPDCRAGQVLATELADQVTKLRQERLDRLYQGAGLPGEIRRMSFKNFHIETNLDELCRVKERVIEAARSGWSLLLMGNPGQGKTHLAAAYLNDWIGRQGRTGLFVSLVDLMASLRRTIRSDQGPDWDTTLDRYIEAELLVLDDLGQEKASEKVVEVVFHLLNSRINRGRPTVVTTNYSLKSLASDVGYPPSVCSRLASFERVAWQSADYRLKR